MLFLIVRCCKCGHFGVKQETKSAKWACKLCGEKQTQTRVYGTSSKASELRPVMQLYNMQRGAFDEAQRDLLNRVAPELDAAASGVSAPLANQWDQFVELRDDTAAADAVDDEDDDCVSLRLTAAVELGAKRQSHVPRKRPARATEDEFDAPAQTALSVPAKSRARLDDDRPVPVRVGAAAWPTPVASAGSSAANRSAPVSVSAWPTASAASASKTALMPPVPPREAVARVAVASEEVCDWNAFVEEPGVDDDDDDDDAE